VERDSLRKRCFSSARPTDDSQVRRSFFAVTLDPSLKQAFAKHSRPLDPYPRRPAGFGVTSGARLRLALPLGAPVGDPAPVAARASLRPPGSGALGSACSPGAGRLIPLSPPRRSLLEGGMPTTFPPGALAAADGRPRGEGAGLALYQRAGRSPLARGAGLGMSALHHPRRPVCRDEEMSAMQGRRGFWPHPRRSPAPGPVASRLVSSPERARRAGKLGFMSGQPR